MRDVAAKLGEYLLLVAVTIVACAVMWWVNSKNAPHVSDSALVERPTVIAAPKPLVATQQIPVKLCEVTSKLSGKVRSWEGYSLGFEVPGRVLELGQNAGGEPLDEGDVVTAGQVIARLDDRIYAARKDEAVARFEQAASDFARARRLFEGGTGATTESEYQQALTDNAQAKAAQEIAIKNLEDTVLTSPVSGTIAKRMAEPGESVSANQVVFEIVENAEVLLVVEAPESQVREFEARMRTVEAARQAGATDPEDKLFRAHVNLEGRDVFGKPWPPIEAEVYRIAQVADPRTGLFEVEIRIPNGERLLREGMVATAELVVDRVQGYELPESAVLFRGRNTFLFDLQTEPTPAQAMFWQVGELPAQRARKVELAKWIDQGDTILAPASSSLELGPVVIRGQQRLADGQLVRVVDGSPASESRVVGNKVNENNVN